MTTVTKRTNGSAKSKPGRKNKLPYTPDELVRGLGELKELIESADRTLALGGFTLEGWYGWPALKAAVEAYLDTWSPRKQLAHLVVDIAAELASGRHVD